jgi:hypothetical protein
VIIGNGSSLVMLAISGSGIVYWSSSYSDTGSAVTLTAEAVGTSAGSDVTLIADPGAVGAAKRVAEIWLRNDAGVTQTIQISVRTAGPTDNVVLSCLLRDGDTLRWGQDQPTPLITSANGVPRGIESNAESSCTLPFYKSGTAAEAAGNWYCTAKDTGVPGAITVGTPGLSGRAVTGSPPTPEPGSIWLSAPIGQWHMTYASAVSSTVHAHLFFDLLWINSGIVVTTTTAQTINSVTLPSRSVDGSTNGRGCWIGLLVTTATTNAAAIANSTISYTNSNGTAGQTATLVAVGGSQIPATAVIGTLVWFSLAAGDSGVRSIQSITLGTSLVTGTVSLIIARPLIIPPSSAPNLAGSAMISNTTLPSADPGICVWQDPAIFHCYQASATTASTVAGNLVFVDRA